MQVWLVHLERRVWVVLLVLARHRVPGVPRVPTLPGHLRRGCRDNMASMYNCSWKLVILEAVVGASTSVVMHVSPVAGTSAAAAGAAGAAG